MNPNRSGWLLDLHDNQDRLIQLHFDFIVDMAC